MSPTTSLQWRNLFGWDCRVDSIVDDTEIGDGQVHGQLVEDVELVFGVVGPGTDETSDDQGVRGPSWTVYL